MLKIAIVGCGKIADDHLQQIRTIGNSEVVAASDREPLMAEQLCARFAIKRAFSDVGQLLDEARPDVVHLTTPPHSHYSLAMQCLHAGCHVYVEKPFALNARETEKLISTAESLSLKLTVGHDLQFSPVARRMRALIQEGFLGGPPVHMESFYCYDLTDPRYARALLSDKEHWVRRLPGQLLHNVISHGIARIAEFVSDDRPTVSARGFTSPLLRSLGENEIVDELRVIVGNEAPPTAYFTFSSQMRPSLNSFTVYGPKNGLALDQDHETLIRLRGERYKSYVEKFVPPVTLAAQQILNLATNVRKFARNEFHMKSGMRFLIESFYRSISEGTPPPISYREIRLSARIMDAIFAEIYPQRVQGESAGLTLLA